MGYGRHRAGVVALGAHEMLVCLHKEPVPRQELTLATVSAIVLYRNRNHRMSSERTYNGMNDRGQILVNRNEVIVAIDNPVKCGVSG